MGLSIVLQRPHPGIYSTCYISPAKLLINSLFRLKLSDISDRELSALVFVLFLSYSDYFLALGRLAPYLERRCVRLATPAVSRVPRTM